MKVVVKKPINFRNFVGGDIQSKTNDCTYRGRIGDIIATKVGATYRLWVEIYPLLELRNPNAASRECRDWAVQGQTTIIQKFEGLTLQLRSHEDHSLVLLSQGETITLFPPGHPHLLNYEKILATTLAPR